jgi:hypothetical protein
MLAVVVRALWVVLFLVAAQGVAAVEAHPAARDYDVVADAGRPDQAIITTRSLAGASVLRQSSREGIELIIASLVAPAPVDRARCSPASTTIRVRPHLPFCITPRPPPHSTAR